MHSRNTTRLVGLALTAFAGAALPAQAAPPPLAAGKADAALTQQMDSRAAGAVSAIVRLVGPLTNAQQAQIASLGGAVTTRLSIIHSVTVTLPARSLSKLAALPFITHLSSNGQVKKCDEFTTGSSLAAAAWKQYGMTGQGVGIAVVDSGVQHHEDLSQVVVDQDLTNLPPTYETDPVTGVTEQIYDQCGHGTHVAGIIAGDGKASTGKAFYRTFYGVAGGAKIIDVRVLDQNGQGTVGTVVAGIQWVIANKDAYNIRVMNLSLGHPVGESYTTDPLCQAVEAAYKAGITVVCAAGNEGRLSDSYDGAPDNEGFGTNYGSIDSPGNDPYVITVGASKNRDGQRTDDQVATYSSRGPSRLDLILKPDIIAPGNRVISLTDPGVSLFSKYSTNNVVPDPSYRIIKTTGPGKDNGNGNGKGKVKVQNSNKYFTLSGTSMATPVVAGAVALMLQKDPTLTPDTIKARLMLSADKLAGWTDSDGNYDALTYGAGYLDIPAALGSTITAGQPTMSPDLSENADGTVSINMDHAIWGKSLWGTGLTDLHAIWGKCGLWDSNTLASSHAIWGKSVWSDHALWGSSTDAVDLSSIAINGE